MTDRHMQEARELARSFFDARNHEGGFAKRIATALAAAEKRGEEREREASAKIVEGDMRGITVDVFLFNEKEARNRQGHTEFISLRNAEAYLHKLAAAIRSREAS